MKLRSRQYTDLTNYEIESYLERTDIIIIPVGNCEVHGGLPVDCEYRMISVQMSPIFIQAAHRLAAEPFI